VISKTDSQFWRQFRKLPKEVQTAAEKAFRIFQENPDHPSLNFKPLHGDEDFYSARISLKYRVVAQRIGNAWVWFWIGSHSDFDKEFS
jgi:mRNA-degrading endonuclease RelE of RelBE toxin-antitoxin system